MADINVKSEALEKLIEKLEADNKNIYNIAANININIRNLDSSFWSSREKTKFDEVAEPFMNKNEYDLLAYLNECTNLLRVANGSYEEQDDDLANAVNNS